MGETPDTSRAGRRKCEKGSSPRGLYPISRNKMRSICNPSIHPSIHQSLSYLPTVRCGAVRLTGGTRRGTHQTGSCPIADLQLRLFSSIPCSTNINSRLHRISTKHQAPSTYEHMQMCPQCVALRLDSIRCICACVAFRRCR